MIADKLTSRQLRWHTVAGMLIICGLLLGCDPNVLPESPTHAPSEASSPTVASVATKELEALASPALGVGAYATLPPIDSETVASPTPPDPGLAATPAAEVGFDGGQAKAHVDMLAGEIGRRPAESSNLRRAAEYIAEQFIQFGYTDVFTQPLTNASIPLANVVAVRPAATDSPIIMYTAHYDSVVGGPGATDDGSGTAIMLELARVLRERYPNYELRFVAFTAEESGLLGSDFYLKRLNIAERHRIMAVINLDSAAVGRHLLVVGDVNLAGVALAEGKRLGLPIEDYTVYNDSLGSDHIFFLQSGLPAITLGRWLDHCYHQACDTAGRVSPAALTLIGGLAIAITNRLTE